MIKMAANDKNMKTVRTMTDDDADKIREAIAREKCSFFNIVQKAFAPPPPFI